MNTNQIRQIDSSKVCSLKVKRISRKRNGESALDDNMANYVRWMLDMLEHPISEGIVGWGKNGTGLLVTDIEKFANELLPRFFKTKKYSSFQRNLNKYGFSKNKKRRDGVHEYNH
jgi:hypothetical protein